MHKCIYARMMLLALALCLVFAGSAAAEEERFSLPSGISSDEIERHDFDLPEGYSILDAAWIGNAKNQVLLLLGSPEENAVKLAAADLAADGAYQLAACSGALLPYQNFDPLAGIMMDKWKNGRPYYWWGANSIPTDREIYLSLRTNEEGAWYVSFGHIADEDGIVQCAFWQEDPGSLTVRGETAYPQIRWRTEASLLQDFNLNAVEEVCRGALDFVQVIQQNSECLEYRIEEPGGNG